MRSHCVVSGLDIDPVESNQIDSNVALLALLIPDRFDARTEVRPVMENNVF